MGYHMLPRFAGQPLVRTRLAAAQSWLAIAGVALIGLAWVLLVAGWPPARLVLISGGTAQVAAAGLFAILIGEVVLISGRYRRN